MHAETPSNYGWDLIGSNETSRVEMYRRGSDRIDFYPTTGTVKTMVSHPKRGRNDLFRKNLTSSELGSVFANPRSHTGKGYRRRRRKS